MAADVCAEQLPSTSYATTSPLRSCFISEVHSKTERKQDSGGQIFPISSLPAEIHLHILKHLARVDIDRCKLVCKNWRDMINGNSHSLKKHVVNVLKLTERKYSFTLSLKCPNFAQSWTFCEDVDVWQSQRGKRHILSHFDERAAKIPHMLIYVTPKDSEKDDYITEALPIELEALPLEAETSEGHRARKQREHTPPNVVFERIAKCFANADIKTVKFTELRFTDDFVERLSGVFNSRKVRCKKLEITFCKLNYISPKKFYQFLNMFECEKISLMWLRGNCGHIVDNEQFRTLFTRCRTVCLCAITPTVSVGDDAFLQKFLKHSTSKKVLLLDQCSVTSSGLIQAVHEWRSLQNPWKMNLCLEHDLISINTLIVELGAVKDGVGNVFRITHPAQSGELRLWRDDNGVHIATA